jgi:hypothetical protein
MRNEVPSIEDLHGIVEKLRVVCLGGETPVMLQPWDTQNNNGKREF